MVKQQLLQRFSQRSACIGIIGLGYVGLPLMLRFQQRGFQVVGFDIDSQKVQMLNAGSSYIEHIADAAIQRALQQGFSATSDFEQVSVVDAVLLCVPTPLTPYREPDLSYVVATTASIVPHLRAGQLVSLESTTYPGTTEELLLPPISSVGLSVGQDIFLVYSPEREDPGNPSYSTQTIPKVVGGHTANCLEVGCALYAQAIDKVVPVSSTRVAEMTKLLENIHRAVNIGLVNEMKIVSDKMGLDIFEVIRAAATKPFGFVPYFPGPGLGGHCIPIDPFYLAWKARAYGVNTRFIELAGEVNTSMPDWVIMKMVEALNARQQSVRGRKVLVLGIAYKRNVDDMRESPAVALMQKLQALGAVVAYSDPHVPVFPRLREHHFDLSSVSLTAEHLAAFDVVLLATDHDRFDYEHIRSHARLIIDTRGRYREPAEHIIRA